MKHLNPRASDAYELHLTAISKFQQGYPRIGYELMSQAQAMMANVYGTPFPRRWSRHARMPVSSAQVFSTPISPYAIE